MEMNIHPVLPEELPYMWHRPGRDSGCIGCLTARLQAHSPEFESSWLDCTPSLNTPEFTDDFNDMMDSLRQGILKSPSELCAYCTCLLYTSDVYKRQMVAVASPSAHSLVAGFADCRKLE